MRDTLPLAESARVAAIRRMAPAARLRQALDLSDAMRRVAVGRLRAVHPGRPDRELMELLRGADHNRFNRDR
jgi:hypothetical protein